MRLGRYSLLTTIGTVPWYFGLAAVGVAVGASWERFHEAWHYADYAILALIVAAGIYIVFRTRRRRVARRALERV
jgi:membrane protein DedA with SNARE-associated domain